MIWYLTLRQRIVLTTVFKQQATTGSGSGSAPSSSDARLVPIKRLFENCTFKIPVHNPSTRFTNSKACEKRCKLRKADANYEQCQKADGGTSQLHNPSGTTVPMNCTTKKGVAAPQRTKMTEKHLARSIQQLRHHGLQDGNKSPSTGNDMFYQT
jgi:hypothetical protein